MRRVLVPVDGSQCSLRAVTCVSHADALACDLIAMGTHGHGALAGLLLDSNAAKVIHHARLPLLLVK